MKTVVVPIEAAPPDTAALPPEWAAWSEEPGRAVRIEEDGAVLGVVHAAVVGRAEAWFEGLWVRPSARGRGIGGRLVAEAESLVRGHGAAVARTAVPARDYGALAVAERAGYVRHSEAAVLVGPIPAGPVEASYEAPVRAARVEETAVATRLLAGSAPLAAWRGLLPLGWRFRRLVPELVRGLIKDRRVLLSGREPEGVALFAVRGGDVVLSTLAGAASHREALFGSAVGRARAEGASRIALFSPDARGGEDLRATLVPHPWCPDGLVLVEKAL